MIHDDEDDKVLRMLESSDLGTKSLGLALLGTISLIRSIHIIEKTKLKRRKMVVLLNSVFHIDLSFLPCKKCSKIWKRYLELANAPERDWQVQESPRLQDVLPRWVGIQEFCELYGIRVS